MSLNEILLVTKNNARLLVLLACLGAIAGIAAYFYPAKYIASGAIFVKRQVEVSANNTYFGYEGYYAQQVAISYTTTTASLLESIDVRKRAMEKLNVSVDTANLKRFARLIRAKKSAPQLVTLTTKGKTQEEARELWNAVAQTVLDDTNKQNADGDPKIRLSTVSPEPIVTTPQRSLVIFLAAGLLLAQTCGFFYIFNSYKGTKQMQLIINTDGGARGNPGPAGIGVVITNSAGSIVSEISKYIGVATNNIAEYTALIEGLTKCKELGATELSCKLDSELVVRQLNGIYKVKDTKMKELYNRIKALETNFKVVTYLHVRREQNKEADKLVNIALDAVS